MNDMSGATVVLCVSDNASNVTKMCKLLPIDNLDMITSGCSGSAVHMITWLNLLSADVEADDLAVTFL